MAMFGIGDTTGPSNTSIQDLRTWADQHSVVQDWMQLHPRIRHFFVNRIVNGQEGMGDAGCDPNCVGPGCCDSGSISGGSAGTGNYSFTDSNGTVWDCVAGNCAPVEGSAVSGSSMTSVLIALAIVAAAGFVFLRK